MAEHRPAHFFKYTSSSTARTVLKNHTLRWSAPSRFNDPFDVQFDMHVTYDRKTLIEEVMSDLWKFYSGEKEFQPANTFGYFLKRLSASQKQMTRLDFDQAIRKGIEESLDVQKKTLPELHASIRGRLNCVQILCFSETPKNILMWSHYAENHSGVVLRLSDIQELESPWGVAKPVQYRREMPLLLNHNELLAFLTGQSAIDGARVLEECVTVKAIDWEYEKEWRVIYHGSEPIEFEDTKFDPKQLTRIYFGCRASENNKKEITELAKAANPEIEIFMGHKSEREFEVEFKQS